MLLDDIVSSKKTEVMNIKKQFQFITLSNLAEAFPPARDFRSAISRPGHINLIAELKKASPSAGTIIEDYVPEPLAKIYQSAGAAALSVLTDGPFFQGLLGHLKASKQATELPVLRKDFIIDELQIFESRLAGADAILLIARILSDEQLKTFILEAKKIGLTALVEVHSEAEAERALNANAEMIGVNNRVLDTLKVDLNLSLNLIGKFPELKTKVTVSESGISDASQVGELRSAGFNAVLIGEALLKSKDIPAKIKDLGF